jgi:hypothetical protein
VGFRKDKGAADGSANRHGWFGRHAPSVRCHDADALERAEERFQELAGKGFRAVALGKDGQRGELIREFDPSVERTLFIPQLQGG